MICVPIKARTFPELLRKVRKANQVTDLLELRLDYFPKISLERVFSASLKPVIVTCRKKSEGGKFSGSEQDRLRLLHAALRLQPAYLDLELSVSVNAIENMKKVKGKTKLILSWHNFEKTPSLAQFKSLIQRAERFNPDIIKLVSWVNSFEDVLTLFEIQKYLNARKIHSVVLGMGRQGIVTRVLAPIIGSEWTYASLSEGEETAPGQVTAEELRERWGRKQVSLKTAILGIVGKPLAHSLSPLMHRTWIKASKLDAVYEAFEVEDIGQVRRLVKLLKPRELAVTMPFKRAAMKLCDKIDPVAKKIGAINTLVRSGTKYIGFNTDLYGIEMAFKKSRVLLRGKKVALIGAGGAARPAAYFVNKSKGHLTVFNRNLETAKKLVKEFGGAAKALSEIVNEDFDILINATPIGMYDTRNQSPVPVSILKSHHVVFDMIYNPRETKLLKDAKRKGAKTISGMEMFVWQGKRQMELWSGRYLNSSR